MSLMNKYFPVLDHGFVALKDIMGSDQDIEQAARVSYGKGTRQRSDTRNLIRYLMRHRHTSPFEQVEFKFHVCVPMDCWRQWIRHRTASINEYSTRYSEAINFYQKTPPNKWRLQSNNNKQGSDDFYKDGDWLSQEESKIHDSVNNAYQRRLDVGIAREQARKDLPLSTYTEAFWKIDLHNLLHFLNLRCKSNAQEEIRQYAKTIAGIVKYYCPLTFEAWEDYVFNSITFSQDEQTLLFLLTSDLTNRKQAIENIIHEGELSKREAKEFYKKIDNLGDATIDFTLLESQAKPYSYFKEPNT